MKLINSLTNHIINANTKKERFSTNMRIIFLKSKLTATPYKKEDRIELYPDISWDSKYDPWDDFHYKTTFCSALFFNNKEYEMPNIKILMEETQNTHSYFKELVQDLSQDYFKFPLDCNYISQPTDIEFYETLQSLFKREVIEEILKKLSDATYIKNTIDFKNLGHLIETDGFKTSLLRDMTSKKAFKNGWDILSNRTIEKNSSFKFSFNLDNYNNQHEVEINFRKSIFPDNINILIGSNGTGKSQTLMHLINKLLGLTSVQSTESIPIFNQIVAIAYSPFENFLTSLDEESINIKSVYKYLGFRNKEGIFNRNQPNINSINSILEILSEDYEKMYLVGRKNKYETFINVMKKAIDFDFIGFEMTKLPSETPYGETLLEDKYYQLKDKEVLLGHSDIYEPKMVKEAGIRFFKNDKLLFLSSGQQIFAQLISSIVNTIREDTIILVDEPELYLHPNLEVELINLLKDLLSSYNSHAIIATHSSIIAREVSKEYITIFKRVEEEIKITRPPFETIGGNLERINSYIFFDKDIVKPYQNWLQSLVNDVGDAKETIEKYKDELNEESLIQIHGLKVENAD